MKQSFLKSTSSFTCEECIEGMEWIEAYMEDPIFQVLFHPKPKKEVFIPTWDLSG